MKQSLLGFCVATAIFFCIPLFSTEYTPWFGPVLEVEGRALGMVQVYPSVDSKNRRHHKHGACNEFIALSGSMAIYEDLAFEIESLFANTGHHDSHVDSVSATGRYRFLNDIVGDFVSLSVGVKIEEVFKPARHDIALFHHGQAALETHLALGKEFSCLQFWSSRISALTAFGIGSVGSPWVKGGAMWQWNYFDQHEVHLSLLSLFGLGHKRLNVRHFNLETAARDANLTQPSEPQSHFDGVVLHHLGMSHPIKSDCSSESCANLASRTAFSRFKGYGTIRHESLDLAIGYTYMTDGGIYLMAEYAFRPFAKNCPENVSLCTFGLRYNFGL